MAMHTAVELGIFDGIGRAGPAKRVSAAEIASELSCKNAEAPSSLDRLLRLLSSHFVLHCSVIIHEENCGRRCFRRLYSLVPVAKFFVRNDDGVSLGPLIALLQDKVFIDSWLSPKEAILEGGIGSHAFEYLRLDSRFNHVFNKSELLHNGRNNQPPETDEQEEESFSYAMQLATSTVMSMAVQTVAELGVFDIIHKAGPRAELSAAEIASQLPCKNSEAPSVLDRLLRLLASHSVLHCSVIPDETQGPGCFRRLYSLAPAAKFFVRNADGVSLGPFIALFHDKVFLESWSQMKEAILEGGIAFNRVHGSHAFEYPGQDSRFNDVFNKAMVNHTSLAVPKILESYKGFEDITRLVDVGGGFGVTLNLITSKYPHMLGINFDLPHVLQHAPSYPRVEHVGGDMFESVPRADAVLMKWILHDWSDELCLKLLKNCYEAIPEDGKVIVVEALFPVVPETSVAMKSISQLDVHMMTQNPGGKERSEQEFMELATSAGFSGIRYECFVRNYWVMEFFK